MKNGPKVAIIAAGLTGLSCAFHLEKANISPQVYEKEERVGGRIRSEKFQGFTLDRGFQVVMTSYPEFRKLFDLKKLQLSAYDSGAMIRKKDNEWIPLYHPVRHPIKWSFSFLNRPSQLLDFSKLLYYYSKYRSEGKRWEFATMTTEEFLSSIGITNKSIDKFLRHFFGGVFLEKELNTQAALFMRRFHHFLWGKACLPAEGMEAIPKQLTSRLKVKSDLLTLIKTYSIPHALPMQDHPPPLADYHHPRIANVYLAGELVDAASINGALESGRKIAERIIRDLDL